MNDLTVEFKYMQCPVGETLVGDGNLNHGFSSTKIPHVSHFSTFIFLQNKIKLDMSLPENAGGKVTTLPKGSIFISDEASHDDIFQDFVKKNNITFIRIFSTRLS